MTDQPDQPDPLVAQWDAVRARIDRQMDFPPDPAEWAAIEAETDRLHAVEAARGYLAAMGRHGSAIPLPAD